jgi:anti-sigma regulatory factor (Ser/Thr protein kinase)
MKANSISRFSELGTARFKIVDELRHAADMAASDFQAAQLIVTELLSNALRHGPGPASYALEWDGDAAVLHVWDCGPAFDSIAEPPPPDADGGRGLHLVRRFARGLHIRRTHQGNHVRCILPVAACSRRRNISSRFDRALAGSEGPAS